MKKFCLIFLTALLLPLVGCNTSPNFSNYVSDERYDWLQYADDKTQVDVQLSHREVPFEHDGIVGKREDLIEVYVSLMPMPTECTIHIGDEGGEMSFLTVKNCFYWSQGKLPSDMTSIAITVDGDTAEFPLSSIKYEGVISTRQALDCVVEHATTLFEGLSQGKLFAGEITVRLLYDEGCFYYVGITDEKGHTIAYLVDGERGKVLAEHKN